MKTLIMPEDSRLDIEDDIFGKHLPNDQLYDDLTIENLEEIHDNMLENKRTVKIPYCLLMIFNKN
jgi:hypothetical protein